MIPASSPSVSTILPRKNIFRTASARRKPTTATGPTTGLIVSEDGYVVSSSFNFVHKPNSILVTLPNGKRAAAEVVGKDHSRMLVLLKVKSDQLLPVPQAAPPVLDHEGRVLGGVEVHLADEVGDPGVVEVHHQPAHRPHRPVDGGRALLPSRHDGDACGQMAIDPRGRPCLPFRRGWRSEVRQLARTAAMLACLLQATLLPWLGATMQGMVLLRASLNDGLTVICHSADAAETAPGAAGNAVAESEAGRKGVPAPSKDNGDCEVCKSLAAAQFALFVAAALGLLETPATTQFASLPPKTWATRDVDAPRSRGPPGALDPASRLL